MNIENKHLEQSCSGFGDKFLKYFDWGDIDVTYSRVDLINHSVRTISSNYNWVLMVWDDDLDKKVKERLIPGIQYWNNYSTAFQNTLSKTDKKEMKVDFCTQYGDVYEITSINSRKKFSCNELLELYKLRAVISDYSQNVWKDNEDIILPLRADISLSQQLEDNARDILDVHHYMRFGNIRFTRKEMMTIRLLLSHCRVKEISYIQGCSEATENKRIQRIKEKLGCSYTSPSGLFKALKENGITLACLESLVSYP
ncbi:TPA: helix-turn-helix transcriptional regulator [Providencia rettgeri]